MTSMESQPSNPDQWQRYATSDSMVAIPLQAADDVKEDSGIVLHRGILLDACKVLSPSMHSLSVYADVLAFTENEITIAPAKNGIVQIWARVLTAATPITLEIPPGDAASCAIAIYASVVDQPISVRTGDSQSTKLNLGPCSDNVGVVLTFSNGEVQTEYAKRYSIDNHSQMQAHLETSLRIALAQLWQNVSIGISICAWVAAISHNMKEYSLLNAQAVALGQQFAGRIMAGKNASYAPVLVLDTYQNTMKLTLEAAKAFEDEFHRFQTDAEIIETQKDAWKSMLEQAEANQSMRTTLRDSALAKYKYAASTAASCETQFQDDNDAVKRAQIDFQEGIEKWEFEQKLKAIFEIFKAIVTFAIGVGELCIGDLAAAGGAAKAVDEAVEAAKAAEEIADQVEAVISSGTLEELGKVAKALYKLYPSVAQIVDAVQKLESEPDINIPSMGDISGSTEGDADAAAIVTIAAWEKWILESDAQMEFAIKNEIGGATEYQLALRKHAINGKQLAQAQAEAVKAGYEYVQAQLEVVLCNKQIENLQAWIKTYEGEEETYLQAEAYFYDRAFALRIGIVIELQNMVWAYRYWALADSSIVLDATKSLPDYAVDLATIARELENIGEQYGSDFQGFSYPDESDDLPSNFGPMLLEGLKGETHAGSFTLAPQQELAGKFFGGSHYRLSGMDPTLNGARPKSDAIKNGTAVIHLEITTSGIYDDINKDEIFHFASIPQVRRCSYELDTDGNRGATLDNPVFETKYHAEPTPFTRWKIKLLNPDEIDLSGLVGVDFMWVGTVRFDPTRQRRE